MVIGICDDEKIMRESVEAICKQVANSYKDESIIIETFTDGKEVLEGEYDILILDIEMEKRKQIADHRRRNADESAAHTAELRGGHAALSGTAHPRRLTQGWKIVAVETQRRRGMKKRKMDN